MALIININSVYPSPSAVLVARGPDLCQPHGPAPEGDTVSLSRFGRVLSHAVEESSFRIARVRAIRAEIESGTYETTERIKGTVERLLDVVG